MVASPGIVGNYVIERELGRGGMGVVYAATHRVLAKPAAIKLLLGETSQRTDQIERFFNEARAAMAIDHPGIVKILDVGWSSDGRAYIAMELLAGESLADQLDRGPLPIRIAVERARQIADALCAAHAAGVIHRDLKPENVMVVAGGRIKLLDFGIAKLGGSLAGSVKTVTGATMGTPTYMSPEQCEGSLEIDARSDLYSLGCVLFAMLTGRPPFDTGGAGGVMGAHLHVPPPRLRTVCGAASPALEAVVESLLAKSRDARFQTAHAVVAALSAPDVTTIDGPDATANMPAAGTSDVQTVPNAAPASNVASPPHAPPPAAPAVTPARSKRWLAIGGVTVIAIAAVIAVAASGGKSTAISSRGSEGPAGTASTSDAAITTPDASARRDDDDGTIPKVDFPAVATTARPGEWVLTINKLTYDRFVANPETNNVMFYSYELSEAGAKVSRFKDMGKDSTAPNSLVIAIPKGGRAKVGDIVLTWWQSGSGMERAIVVEANDPKQPTVRYLDIAYDNPARGGPKHDTPIGQMDEQLKPDSFTLLTEALEPGTTVACKDAAKDYQVAHVVTVAGDKILLSTFAGMIVVRKKVECVALPLKPSVKVNDKIMGDFAGTMRAATVTKVDAMIGRVWVTFDGLGKDEHALAFGNVIGTL